MSFDDPADAFSALGRLPRSERRRVFITASLRAVATTAIVVLIYFLIPMDRSLSSATVIGLVLGLLALIAVIALQVHRIVRSEHPTLRAVEALALTIPLYVLLFATGYYLVSRANVATFGESLTRIDAMYFSATVVTTVGFGDITAKTQAARVLVTIQMMLDLVIIGLVVRLVVNAVKVGQRRHEPTAESRRP